MQIKLLNQTGNDAEILITYDDESTETVTLSGLPTVRLDGETDSEIASRFISAVTEYIKKYIAGKVSAEIPEPDPVITALIGKSKTITL